MRTLVIAFVFGMVGIVSATLSAINYKCIILWHANGLQTSIELYKEPRINFDQKSVIIHSPVLELIFPKEDILKYTFENRGDETSIEKVRINKLKVQVTDTQVTIIGDINKQDVFVYDISGRKCPVTVYRKDDSLQFSLVSFSAGLYILAIGDQSFKFSKL